MKMRYYLLFFLTIFSYFISGQNWKEITKSEINSKGQIDFQPKKYKLFEINDEEVYRTLSSAPHEKDVKVNRSNVLLNVPSADGTVYTFKIVKYDMMERGLQLQFPHFLTLYGVDVNDNNRGIRIDHTNYGFRAVIRDENESTFIEYFVRGEKNYRIAYFKHDYPRTKEWSCAANHEEELDDEHRHEINNREGDCIFRTYRLANAATGEYTAFHGGTVATAQSAIVTTINRVNQIYESDLAVRLILIANNTSIIYTNPATDPYTNNNGTAMLTENVNNLNAVIGAANFDIGHVFSTGGGGVAGLGVVCGTGKAKGVTGSPAPVGDPYDIDYVCHEVGHQFKCQHTFSNHNLGACNGNNVPAASFEVGSGITIMGYAGICGASNVAVNSIASFHAHSLFQAKTFIQSQTCHSVVTSFSNLPPIVDDLPNYSIPLSTPFVLTGSATDPNNNTLTYDWQQMDVDTMSLYPNPASTKSSLFRNFLPSSSPTRYFPNLVSVVNNASPTWEVLPTAARNMKFRMTVRDHFNSPGCTSEDDVVLTTVAGTGPFQVTVKNSSPVTPLIEGQTFTVTWNVANTNLPPINCSLVSIYLSKDGGSTFPIILSNGVPNDGSQDVNIPLGTAANCRIMVKALNNVFYDINNLNFPITVGSPTFLLSLNPISASTCSNQNANTTVSYLSVGGYNTPVTLSASGLPPGASASFSPTTIGPGQNSIMMISNLTTANGFYPITITGTTGTLTKSENFLLNVVSLGTAPTLISPANNATSISLNPILDWSNTGSGYEYQLSRSSDFSDFIQTGIVTPDSIAISSVLMGNSKFYWRVRTSNSCGTSSWSPTFNFTTKSCFDYVATDTPITIPTGGTINSYRVISDKGTISNSEGGVDISNLVGQHSYIDDLRFTLFSPSGTNVLFWDRPCDNHEDFDIKFDDAAATQNHPCPPTDKKYYKPSNPFTPFNGANIKGQWRLKVDDLFTPDGGVLNTWTLRVCANNFCRLLVENNYVAGVGSLKEAVNCASSGDTIRFAASLNNQTLDLKTDSLVINKNLTLLSTVANNISIKSNSTASPTIVIPGNHNVKIIGLKIIGSEAPNTSGIKNLGNLTLNNSQVLKNGTTTANRVVQNIGTTGKVTLEGTCRID